MQTVEQALSYLGLPVRDRVTGFQGVVVSVSFDLYGCVQAFVHPGVEDTTGKMRDDHFWFDLNRLEAVKSVRVMGPPAFAFEEGRTVSFGAKGPAEKPAPGRRA